MKIQIYIIKNFRTFGVLLSLRNRQKLRISSSFENEGEAIERTNEQNEKIRKV